MKILAYGLSLNVPISFLSPITIFPIKNIPFLGTGLSRKLKIIQYLQKRYLIAELEGFEPSECWSQSPVPYRLATAKAEKY